MIQEDFNDFSPCPFCENSKPKLIINTPVAMAGSIITFAYVMCEGCKARGPETDDWKDSEFKEHAYRKWQNPKGLEL